MQSVSFAERAKAFRDTFLAERTADILKRINLSNKVALAEEDVEILNKASELVEATNKGLMAVQGKPAEFTLLPYADCLWTYQASFSAMVNAAIVHEAEDVQGRLQSIQEALKEAQQGEKVSSTGLAAAFFDALSAVRSDEALAPLASPPQRLPDIVET